MGGAEYRSVRSPGVVDYPCVQDPSEHTELKTRDKIIEAHQPQKFAPKRLMLLKAKHKHLDDAVDLCLMQKRSGNVAIGSGHLRAACR